VGVTADLLAEDSTGPSYPTSWSNSSGRASGRGVPHSVGRRRPGQTKSDRTKQTKPASPYASGHRRPAQRRCQLGSQEQTEEERQGRRGFTGGGTIAQGSWQKAFRLAGSAKRRSSSSRRTGERRRRWPDAQAEVEDFVLDAQACGLPCIPLTQRRGSRLPVATEAIAQARKGNGPTSSSV